jgi:hypothetical protein
MTDRQKLICELVKCAPLPFRTIKAVAIKLIDAGVTFRNGAPTVCHCKDCQNGTDDSWPDGKVWCRKMCRYMKKDGFCSEGEKLER